MANKNEKVDFCNREIKKLEKRLGDLHHIRAKYYGIEELQKDFGPFLDDAETYYKRKIQSYKAHLVCHILERQFIGSSEEDKGV